MWYCIYIVILYYQLIFKLERKIFFKIIKIGKIFYIFKINYIKIFLRKMNPLHLSTMIDPNLQLEEPISSEYSNNINTGAEINDIFKKRFSEYMRNMRVNHIFFLASAFLLFMFIMLLINIIYSYYNKKVIKNRKKNYEGFAVIEISKI